MRTTAPRTFLGFVWLAAIALLLAGCSQNPPSGPASTTSSNARVAHLASPISPSPGVYATALEAGIAGAEAKTGYRYANPVPKDTSKPVLIGDDV